MAEKIYYSMGEVAEMLDVSQSLLRFWERKFDLVAPHKNKKGNRLFTPADVRNLKTIYHLVKERGMTLAGADKYLKANRRAVERDVEIAERLQSIRALLLEVRNELGGDGTVVDDAPEEITGEPRLRLRTAAPNLGQQAAIPETGQQAAALEAAPDTGHPVGAEVESDTGLFAVPETGPDESPAVEQEMEQIAEQARQERVVDAAMEELAEELAKKELEHEEGEQEREPTPDFDPEFVFEPEESEPAAETSRNEAGPGQNEAGEHGEGRGRNEAGPEQPQCIEQTLF